MTIKLDHYQMQFKDAVVHTRRPVLCRAVAGHGKTTILDHSTRGLIDNGYKPQDITRTSFNKSIQLETEKRVPPGVICKTFDGLAWHAVKKHYGLHNKWYAKNWVREGSDEAGSGDKYRKISGDLADFYYDSRLSQEQEQDVDAVAKLSTFCLNTLTDYNDWDAVINMASNYSLLLPVDEKFGKKAVPTIIRKGLKEATNDFGKGKDSGMSVYTCAELRYLVATEEEIKPQQYPVLMVDEIQDANRSVLRMLWKMTGERMVCVGDKDQQLYGFLGADLKCWDRLKKLKSRAGEPVVEVDCPVSYRCPSSVVAVAKRFVSRLEAAPNAPAGSVTTVKAADLHRNIQPGHVFITLTNADAILVALRCIEYGLDAYVKGRDVFSMMKEVVRNVSRYKDFKFDHFLAHLQVWKDQRINATYRMTKEPGRLIASIADKARGVEALYKGAVARGVKNITQLNAYIEDKFSDKEDAVMIMALTAWKAKGLQYENVWVFNKDLEIEGDDWKTEERRHAAYVAVTRCMKNLYILSGETIPTIPELDPDHLDFGDA